MSHLERLRRWRGAGVTPAAEISHYDCKDAYGQNVRVYVYAESWGRVEPTAEAAFIAEAQQLHDVSGSSLSMQLSLPMATNRVPRTQEQS